MICDFCACEKPSKGACPICGKGVVTEVTELTKPSAEEEKPAPYKCHRCNARKVIELVMHDDGVTNLLYLLDRNIRPLDEDWSALKNPQVLDLYCAQCNKRLTSDERISFFEETDVA